MNFQDAFTFLQSRDPLRITVSGDIGAGKSTFAKRLAADLGIPRIYIGQFMREEAARRGISLDELNALLETDDTIDRQMDALQEAKSQEISRGVFEGRTSWYFVKNADVKLFFTVDPRLATERIWNDNNALRDSYASVEALMQANAARKASENARYGEYYGIDAYDFTNFDIVIDTSDLDIQAVYEYAICKIALFLS